uniref:LCP family protein n=1 Tax=Kineosporia sp. A_224 TaxID=1962180 RepID=UPI00117A4835
ATVTRRRARGRRVTVAVAAPLVAAAAAAAVAFVPWSFLPGALGVSVPAANAPASRPAPWGDAARVDVLLLGTDAAADRVGARVDTAVLASVDTRTGETLLVGVPRNRLGNRDAGGRWVIDDGIPGVPVRDQVEDLTGQRVDATVTLDMAGFSQLVDTLGGVEVTVPRSLPVGGARRSGGRIVERPVEYIAPGRQRLDGRHALWFARSRYDSDDYDRMRRQRCLLGALADQVDPTVVLVRGPGILAALRGHMSTTVDLRDLPAWVDLLERVRGARVRSVVLDLPVLPDGSPDVTGSRAAVAAALAAGAMPTAGPDGAVTATTDTAPAGAQDLTDVC